MRARDQAVRCSFIVCLLLRPEERSCSDAGAQRCRARAQQTSCLQEAKVRPAPLPMPTACTMCMVCMVPGRRANVPCLHSSCQQIETVACGPSSLGPVCLVRMRRSASCYRRLRMVRAP